MVIKVLLLYFFSLRIIIAIEIPFDLRELSKTNPNVISNERQDSSVLLSQYSVNPITFQLCLGTPSVCHNMIYDTQSYYTYFCSESCTMSTILHYYQSSQSKTFKKRQEDLTHLSNKNTKAFGYGYDSEDKISFNNTVYNDQINDFAFLVMKDVYHPFLLGQADGVLGLNYHYSQLKYSILQVMYFNKWIERTVFAHKFVTSLKGKVFFGETGLDKQTESQMKKCTINSSSLNWECLLFNIQINKEKIAINDNMIFSTGQYQIELPKDKAMNVLMKYKTEIGSSYCDIITEVKIIKLICDKVPNGLPVLSFAFENKMDFIVSQSDLFNYRLSDQRYEFCLVGNELISQGILGLIAMKRYHIVFDKTDSTIGTVLNKDFEEIYQPSNNSFILLTLLFIILIIILLIVICICKRLSGFKDNDRITLEQIQDMTSLYNY